MVAGNWKMNKTVSEAVELAGEIKREFGNFTRTDVVLCPPFTALQAVSNVVSGSHVKVGAQNMHWEKPGAFTGEISVEMIRELFCHYVILGHSERRTLFGETDEFIGKKVVSALAGNLNPILCVGETLDQRKKNETWSVVQRQVEQCLGGVEGGIPANLIIAYEPVWAIGTGVTATPAQAQEAHAFIRKLVAKIAGEKTAESVRILYGGSVKPSNAEELFGQPDIDGGLIGGAALDAASFIAIVKAAV